MNIKSSKTYSILFNYLRNYYFSYHVILILLLLFFPTISFANPDIDYDGDGYSENQGDCNDGNPSIYPGAAEVCDSVDNNCDGSIDEGFDADNDGFTVCNGDCDDADPEVSPITPEIILNGKDDDCSLLTPDWHVECADCPRQLGSMGPRSIATDSSQNPHIAYGNDKVYHAYYDGSSWHVEVVDNTRTGMYVSIAIDSGNGVHISYYDYVHKDLKYATNASGNWVAETVDASGDTGMYSAIALSSTNSVHISYYDITNASLRYATNMSGSWVTTIVDSSVTGSYTTLAIDPDDSVHIAYGRESLMYATNKTGTWVTEMVESNIYYGGYKSIALDTSGYAHISYYRQYLTGYNCSSEPGKGCEYYDTTFYLKYASNSGGTWGKNTLESYTLYGTYYTGFLYSSLALDQAGNVSIAYAMNSLAFITNASGQWQKTSLGAGSLGVFSLISMTMDAQDKKHISYYYSSSGNTKEIRYLSNKSGSWNTATVDVQSGERVGAYNSIAIDANEAIHISYLDHVNHDLRYTTNTSGIWVTQTVDSAGDVGSQTSLAIDSNGKVHIAYYDSTHRSVKYANNVSGVWSVATVDASGYDPSMALDANNHAHISYYGYNASRYLKYATNASGAWSSEIVDNTLYSGTHSSIAVDSSGNIHISYHTPGLSYATNASGSWVIEQVDSSGSAGDYSTSIAVDSSDYVHISYYNSNTYALMYGTNISGAWTTGVLVANAGRQGSGMAGCSIAVNSQGKVYVLYDNAGDELNIVTNVSGQWINELIVTVAVSSSLVLDASDNAHISYNDYYYYLHYASNDSHYADNDGDGYADSQGDCDDTDASINPGAVDTWYDGIDQNCDGWNDYDADMDTYVETAWNTQAGGTSPNTDDCDDATALITPLTYWHPDNDGDGYGNPTVSLQQCAQPAGYVLDNTDCNDSDPNIHGGVLPARVLGTVTYYYTTLQAAYDAAGDGETIQCQEVTFTGDLIIDMTKTVTIEGGYNCGYSAMTGVTTIIGNVEISNGRITIDNITLERQ